MTEWAVKHNDGSYVTNENGERVVTRSLEYSGSWMGECFITVSFKSPSPISFSIGDYIEYRGEKFEINYEPGKIKSARRNSYGEAFSYDNVKFNSKQDELARTEFIDIVLADNNVHYTSLTKFTFYVSSLDDILDRIQANLNEQWGDGIWKLYSRNKMRSLQRGCDEREWVQTYGEGIDDNTIDSTSITADGMTCWDALALIKSKFNINFITRGRNVFVGTAGLPTSIIFKYGKGNGLYQIEQNADSEQSVTTRLKAYGSTKNLPSRYYAELNMRSFANITAVRSKGDENNPYVELLLDLDYSINYFYNDFTVGGQKYYYVKAYCEGAIVNARVSSSGDDGKVVLYSEYSAGSTDPDDNSDKDAVIAFMNAAEADGNVRFIQGVRSESLPSSHKTYITDNLPNNMAIDHLMLPGFPNMSLKEWWNAQTEETKNRIYSGNKTHLFSENKYRPFIDSANKDEIGIRPNSVYFDTEDIEKGIKEIYPTIEKTEINGVRIDEVLGADTIEDNGVFKGGEEIPNFHIYLKSAIDFDINDLIKRSTETPKISMKDGMCGGRNFQINSAAKQGDGSWELVCQRQKDDTLDLYYPYNDFQVSAGDHFILEGIPLPDSYVEAASIKLLQYALRYLDKNDYTRYVYSPKIDEVFMARQHDDAMADVTGNTVSIHDTIKEGDFFQFEDSDLLIEGNVTIDQLNIKEEEGKIPTYEITLREDKSVGTIQKIQERIDSLESNDNGSASSMTVPQIQRIVSSYGGRIFLSKTQDDTANGFIKFLKGFQVGGFSSGLLGEGGVFRKDADGKTYIEADRMYVRMKAYFDNVEIKDYHHAQGNRMVTSAGIKVTRVEDKGRYYRCYFRASDGDNTISNDFVIGDMAYCNVTNIIDGELFQHIYWRLVIGKDSTPTDDEHYIDLSKRGADWIGGVQYAGYMNGSDEPLAQDNVIQLGNVNDSTRRGAIIEYASGADSPSYKIYQNIGNIGNAATLSAKRTAQYTLDGKEMVLLGYNSQTGKAYMNVYGDTFIGDRDGSTYIQYNSQSKELKVKAKIEATSTIDGQSLSNYIKSNQNNFDDSELRSSIQGLQEQIDGEIDTWFFNVNPSATTEPELTWKNTDTANNNNAERLKHLGDVYYNNSNGYAWRYSNTGTESNPVFSWREISDSAVIRALTNAAAAQETADSKITIYTSWNAWVISGSNKLRVKDLFIPTQDATQGGTTYKANKVYRCTNASTPAFFEVAYTDDTKINSYINEIIHGTATSGSDLIKAAAAQRAIMGALNEGTVVDGGLVLTSLIGLRQKSGNNHVMWAGISGQYNSTPSGQTGYAKGNGIASWYGGSMVDKEMLTDAQIEEGWNTHRWARTLFRFDGSGYEADGNIIWDKDGGITIKNITSLYDSNHDLVNLNRLTELTNIFHTTLGAPNNTLYILPQNAFSEIKIVHPSAYTIEGTDVLNMTEMDDRYLTKEIFYKIFSPVFGTNGNLENLQVRGGLWTNSYISALGQNSSQGGGSGTSYNRLDTWSSYDSSKAGWVLSALLGNDLNSRLTTLENGVAPISHTHNWSDITSTPSTIAGYGITDAYISNGVITLGTNTITPITSLAGYATEGWVTNNYSPNSHTHSVKINGVTKTIAGGTAVDLGSYLPLAGGTMTNTNVVTNLNADLLDGQHGSYYAKAADVTTLQGYFTNGVANNADKVDQYHVDDGGFLFKTFASVEIDTADIEGDYWYIHFRPQAWWFSNLERVQLSANYDDVKGVAYIDIPSHYNSYFRAFTTNYKGCNILEVAYKTRGDGHNDLYAKMRKPTSAAKATVNLYATFSSGTLEIIDSAPTNVTFTALTPNAPTNVEANTLATARTIWGQRFDGSSNVSGNLTFMTGSNGMYGIVPNQSGNLDLSIYTEGQPRLTIKDYGNVGIGTSNPTEKLDVVGNVRVSCNEGEGLRIKNLGGKYNAIKFADSTGTDKAAIHYFHADMWNNPSANTLNLQSPIVSLGDWQNPTVYVNSDNRYVGIGTIHPTEKLDVNGNIHASGTIHSTTGIYSEGYVSALGQNTSSDARLKDIQGNVDLPIDMLANAPSKAFVWKGNKALGEQVGTIAQYWQKALPQVVHDNNGYLAMQYDVTALLGVISVAKNVKSHEERIAELEREIEILNNELKTLKN